MVITPLIIRKSFTWKCLSIWLTVCFQSQLLPLPTVSNQSGGWEPSCTKNLNCEEGMPTGYDHQILTPLPGCRPSFKTFTSQSRVYSVLEPQYNAFFQITFIYFVRRLSQPTHSCYNIQKKYTISTIFRKAVYMVLKWVLLPLYVYLYLSAFLLLNIQKIFQKNKSLL